MKLKSVERPIVSWINAVGLVVAINIYMVGGRVSIYRISGEK